MQYLWNDDPTKRKAVPLLLWIRSLPPQLISLFLTYIFLRLLHPIFLRSEEMLLEQAEQSEEAEIWTASCRADLGIAHVVTHLTTALLSLGDALPLLAVLEYLQLR